MWIKISKKSWNHTKFCKSFENRNWNLDETLNRAIGTLMKLWYCRSKFQWNFDKLWYCKSKFHWNFDIALGLGREIAWQAPVCELPPSRETATPAFGSASPGPMQAEIGNAQLSTDVVLPLLHGHGPTGSQQEGWSWRQIFLKKLTWKWQSR